MRYWESKPSERNKKRKGRQGEKRSIVLGGSLKEYPFLRRLYQHQAVINDGIQKFFFFLVIAVLIYAFVLGNGGVIKIFMLQHETAELEKDIAKLQSEILELDTEIERLKNDPFFIEKIGREKYKYIMPGDEVIDIIPRNDEGRALEE